MKEDEDFRYMYLINSETKENRVLYMRDNNS